MSGIHMNEEKLNEIDGQELKTVTGGFDPGMTRRMIREIQRRKRMEETDQELPPEDQGERDGGATGGW